MIVASRFPLFKKYTKDPLEQDEVQREKGNVRNLAKNWKERRLMETIQK